MGMSIKQIATDVSNRGWVTAEIASQIDNQRIRVGNKRHCGGHRLERKLRLRKHPEIDIPNIGGKSLHALDSEINLLSSLKFKFQLFRRRLFVGIWLFSGALGISYSHVLVMRYPFKVSRECTSESINRCQLVISSLPFTAAQSISRGLRKCRKNIFRI